MLYYIAGGRPQGRDARAAAHAVGQAPSHTYHIISYHINMLL